jgi:DNA-binding beta-propeller fold protein YncE
MKRIQRLGFWTQIVFCFLYVNVFGGQEIKVKKENGIPVIYNPKKPSPPRGTPSKLFLEEDLSIGTKEEETKYTFASITAIRADEEGNIYVLDGKEATVNVFDKSGKRLKNIGRRGQGPGEFEMPLGLQIISGRTLIVASMGRLSYLSLQGDFQKQITNTTSDPNPKLDSRGNIIARTMVGGEKMMEELMKFDTDFKPLFKITQLDRGPMLPGMKRNPFPSGVYYSIMTDDRIIWGINTNYMLTIVDRNGSIKRKIIKDYDPIKITDEDKQSIIKQRQGSRVAATQFEFPDYYPPFRDMHTDDENRIFVGTHELNREGYRNYDVFDPEGRYITKIAFIATPLFWKKGNLYCVKENEEGFQVVKRYRATWK